MKEYIEACKLIESDKNYQPNITTRGLFSLIKNADGTQKHNPRKSALVIQNSNIKPVTETGKSLGKIYQIKIARKSSINWDDYPVWNVDNSTVILVTMPGQFYLHSRENAEKGNFDSPLTHLNIKTFLNQSSLSFIETKKQIAEIKKNSQILAQALRTNTSFFSKLSPEILVKIAAFTGDQEIVIATDANQIALDNFDQFKQLVLKN